MVLLIRALIAPAVTGGGRQCGKFVVHRLVHSVQTRVHGVPALFRVAITSYGGTPLEPLVTPPIAH